MSDTAILLENVSKDYRIYSSATSSLLNVLGYPVPPSCYRDLHALKELCLSVPIGQRLGIVGSNGAGKSTLLKIVIGLVKPTTGFVTVRGQVQALMELGTGFHPEFSGRQNVLASLAYRGITGQVSKNCLDEIIEFSELERVIDNPLNTYSSGMYARLAFSVATVMSPEILIIDEILGAGDAYFAGKCMERMRRITMEHGATVLFVSHDIHAVQALCQRVIWLKHGQVAMDGEPLEVARSYYREVQEEENRRLAEQMYRKPNSVGVSNAKGKQVVRQVGGQEDLVCCIESVRFLNASLQPVTGIREGETLVIEMHYGFLKPVRDAVLGISIYLLDGRALCRALKTFTRETICLTPGKNVIRFIFSPFLGGYGEYVASASICGSFGLGSFKPPIVYDTHDRAYRFRVWKELGMDSTPVLVHMPYTVEYVGLTTTTAL